MGFIKYPPELNGMDPQDIYATERLLLAMGTHLHHYMPANQAKIVQKMHELTEEAVGPYRIMTKRLLPYADCGHFTDNGTKALVREAKELVK